MDVVRVHLEGLNDNDRHERDQTKSQEVGDQVMVTQLHVLQVYTLQKVRQPPGGLDLEC